ncbi:MAG: hypothetical protein R3D32_15290 [Nitratireductor sp.]
MRKHLVVAGPLKRPMVTRARMRDLKPLEETPGGFIFFPALHFWMKANGYRDRQAWFRSP